MNEMHLPVAVNGLQVHVQCTWKFDLEILFFEEISCNLTLFDVYDVQEFENLTMDSFMCNVSVNSLLEMLEYKRLWPGLWTEFLSIACFHSWS